MIAYIAGPYRNKDKEITKDNIDRARHLAIRCWQNRIYAICPHMNCAHMENVVDDDKIFLTGLLEIMKKCDVVLLTDQWQGSAGTREEIKIAFDCGIPVIPPELHDFWFTSQFLRGHD